MQPQFIDNLKVPVENLIGEEGKGFRYILDGMNAERILIAAECIGDGRWFIERATNYAKERVVFDRPIGQNQGIQFPIAQAHIHIEAADLMRIKAAELYDQQQVCGAEEGAISYEQVKRVVSQFVNDGADEISIGDTNGQANPRIVYEQFSALRRDFPDTTFVAHFHDTNGFAYANIMAALNAGIESSIVRSRGLAAVHFHLEQQEM